MVGISIQQSHFGSPEAQELKREAQNIAKAERPSLQAFIPVPWGFSLKFAMRF